MCEMAGEKVGEWMDQKVYEISSLSSPPPT